MGCKSPKHHCNADWEESKLMDNIRKKPPKRLSIEYYAFRP